MDSETVQLVKRNLIEYITHVKAVLPRKYGLSQQVLDALVVMYGLETNNPYPDLMTELGEQGYRLFRDSILICRQFNLLPRNFSEKKLPGIISNVVDALHKIITIADELVADEGDFQAKAMAYVKKLHEKAVLLTLALGLPKEQTYDVLQYGAKIDPGLFGIQADASE